MKTAVQQIMLGSVTSTEPKALETLKSVKKAGFDGIELNGFMIKPTPFMVRALTKMAGMPAGKGGRLDWKNLVNESGLEVVSIHEDLGTIERDIDAVISEANTFNTDKIVITGMYRFDYTDKNAVMELCNRLNSAGEKLAASNVKLLYHNHNIEFAKQKDSGIETDYLDSTAYGMIMRETNPEFVNFEMDSYWIADAGVDPLDVMRQLGDRLKLYHINDRGSRNASKAMTPIVKQDSMELGYGNMNLRGLIQQAESVNVDAIILESHKNWIDKDPVKSLTVSGKYLNESK